MGSYSISDLASEFDLTHRSIRFYEDRGLLAPRREGQHRIYDDGQRVRLMLIVRGKRMGFSLQECQQLIDLYDPASGNVRQLEQLLQKISEKRAQLQQQMDDIQTTLSELQRAEDRCMQSLDKARQKAATNRKSA